MKAPCTLGFIFLKVYVSIFFIFIKQLNYSHVIGSGFSMPYIQGYVCIFTWIFYNYRFGLGAIVWFNIYINYFKKKVSNIYIHLISAWTIPISLGRHIQSVWWSNVTFCDSIWNALALPPQEGDMCWQRLQGLALVIFFFSFSSSSKFMLGI
jgi:hypothetical protein